MVSSDDESLLYNFSHTEQPMGSVPTDIKLSKRQLANFHCHRQCAVHTSRRWIELCFTLSRLSGDASRASTKSKGNVEILKLTAATSQSARGCNFVWRVENCHPLLDDTSAWLHKIFYFFFPYQILFHGLAMQCNRKDITVCTRRRTYISCLYCHCSVETQTEWSRRIWSFSNHLRGFAKVSVFMHVCRFV